MREAHTTGETFGTVLELGLCTRANIATCARVGKHCVYPRLLVSPCLLGIYFHRGRIDEWNGRPHAIARGCRSFRSPASEQASILRWSLTCSESRFPFPLLSLPSVCFVVVLVSLSHLSYGGLIWFGMFLFSSSSSSSIS